VSRVYQKRRTGYRAGKSQLQARQRRVEVGQAAPASQIPYEGRPDMKRECLWRIVIGLSLGVGLVAVEPGYADSGDHPQCNLATLKGRYLFAEHGTALPPAFGATEPTPSDAAGFNIFNGDGTGTAIVTFSLGGVTVLENVSAPFSYTVNADCTGSLTVNVPNGPSFGMFIAPNGESFASIATAPPGNAVSNVARRVSRK